MKTSTQATRLKYPSDLNDDQWRRVSQIIGDEPTKGRGRPRIHDLREIVNALAYRWSTGVTWRLLPHDFPAWASVYMYFQTWRRDGRLNEVRAALLQRETAVEAIQRERMAQ